jgi:hypothetical protein
MEDYLKNIIQLKTVKSKNNYNEFDKKLFWAGIFHAFLKLSAQAVTVYQIYTGEINFWKMCTVIYYWIKKIKKSIPNLHHKIHSKIFVQEKL